MKKSIFTLMIILITYNIFGLDLTIEAAKKIALKNNNTFLSEKESLKMSTVSKKKAYLNLLPSANISGNLSQSDPNPTIPGINPNDLQDKNISINTSISQPIFNGGKIWLGAKIQTDAEKISQNKLKQKKIELLNNVESKFYRCLELASQLKNAKLDLKASQKHNEISKTKFENNLISKADYLKSQTSLSNKTIAFMQTRNAYNVSILDLKNTLGINRNISLQKIDLTNTILESKKYLKIVNIEKISNDLIKIAQNKNSNYKILKINRDINKKSLLMSYGNFLPNLSLSYSKNWTESVDPDDKYDKSSTIFLSSSIPIFPIVDNVLSVSSQKHNLKKSMYDLKSMESNLELGINSALQNLILSAQTINSAELSKELATETYNEMEERYKNNLVSLTDLLDTQVMYFSALNQYNHSIYSFLEEKNNLKNQIGLEKFNKIENIIFNKTEEK